jgi:hypothetical protein
MLRYVTRNRRVNTAVWVVGALLLALAASLGAGLAEAPRSEALAVSVEAGPQVICPGWNPHYTFRLTNTLSQPLTNLVISHPVPPGTCLPASGPGSTVPGVYDAVPNVMVWRIERVEPGAEVVAHVRLHSYSYLPHGYQIRGTFQYRADGRGGGLAAAPVTVDRNRCEAISVHPTLTPIPSPTPSPTPATLLRFDPPVANVEQGHTVPVTLTVENVDNLFGIQIEIAFDPLLVQVADSDPEREGVQMRPGIAPLPHYVVHNDANNESGLLRYTVTQLGPGDGFTGAGPVLSFDVLGVSPGQSALTLKVHELATNNAGAIAHRVAQGSVQVTPWIGVPPPTPDPAAPPMVRLEPENLPLVVGETATLRLIVEGMSDLVFADMHLLYDPLLLRVEDEDAETPGIQVGLGQVPYPDLVWENEVDQTTGTIWYSVAQAEGRAPFNGAGVLCAWRVTALAPGTSAVQIPYHLLVDGADEESAHDLRGGIVQIVAQ